MEILNHKLETEDLWGIAQYAGFKLLKRIYLRPGIPNVYSPIYENSYNCGGKRRALLTKEVLKETKVSGDPGPESWLNPAYTLNRCLEAFDASDRLEFFDVKEMDTKLKGANMKDVQGQLRGIGLDFMISMDDVGSEKFFLAHEPSIDFIDLCLGTGHKNYIKPKEGNEVGYEYKESDYPFAQDSPSEKAVWSFAGGAMLPLHSNIESARCFKRGELYPEKPFVNMRYHIGHKDGFVYIYGAEESKLKKRLQANPEELERVV